MVLDFALFQSAKRCKDPIVWLTYRLLKIRQLCFSALRVLQAAIQVNGPQLLSFTLAPIKLEHHINQLLFESKAFLIFEATCRTKVLFLCKAPVIDVLAKTLVLWFNSYRSPFGFLTRIKINLSKCLVGQYRQVVDLLALFGLPIDFLIEGTDILSQGVNCTLGGIQFLVDTCSTQVLVKLQILPGR